MKIRTGVIFIFSLVTGLLHADSENPVKKYFLSLPDSIFTVHYLLFDQADSFPKSERERMFAVWDENKEIDSNRFYIMGVNDSLREISLGNGEYRLTMRVVLSTKKSAFLGFCSELCDFVACRQTWKFYTVKREKITEELGALPACFEMELFFDTAYLAQYLPVKAWPCMQGIEIRFTKDPDILIVTVNGEYFSEELMGDEHPMVKLDAARMKRSELKLKRKGRKFLIQPD
jgi:hypothetical protein